MDLAPLGILVFKLATVQPAHFEDKKHPASQSDKRGSLKTHCLLEAEMALTYNLSTRSPSLGFM